jgi:hypothetical protein
MTQKQVPTMRLADKVHFIQTANKRLEELRPEINRVLAFSAKILRESSVTIKKHVPLPNPD